MTASGAAALALAGCSGDGSGPAGAGPSSPQTTTTSTAATPDPDRVALERAFAITTGLVADLAAANPVVDVGGELAQIHAAHLTALQAAAGAVAPTAEPTAPSALTPARLRRRELAAQRELATLARAADSGALARLFASMSAGIAAGLSHRGEVPR
jgi:hypothetical protein